MQFIKQQLVTIAGELPYNLKTDKRITKKLLKQAKPVIRKPSPLEEALKYANVLKEPSIVSKARLGARFGVSRARVCQILNLLDLDYTIQNYLLSIENVKEHNYFTVSNSQKCAKTNNDGTTCHYRLLVSSLSPICNSRPFSYNSFNPS